MSHSQDTQSSFQLYRRLLSYAMKHWPIFIYAVIGMVIVALATAAFPALLQPLMDEGFAKRGQQSSDWIPLSLIGIFFARIIGSFASGYGMSVIGRSVIRELRSVMFSRLVNLPKSFYDIATSGELISKFSYDVEQVANAATRALTVLIKDTLTIIALLAWMFYLNAQFALVFFVMTPILAYVVIYASKRFRGYSRRIQTTMGDVSRVVEETIRGQLIVKIFGGQAYEKSQFAEANNMNRRQNLKLQLVQSVFAPVIQFFVAIALAVIIYIALHPVYGNEISQGVFVSFLGSMIVLMPSVRSVTSVIAELQRGIAAAESVFEFIDAKGEEDTGTYRADTVAGLIEFNNVSFSYDGHDYAISDFSLAIEKGKTVAFVGRSGSGKSTLINLLPRLYTPSKGEILLDGVNINEYTLDNLRSHISYVGQDIMLFNDTIEHNIAYGSMKNAGHDQIVAAARAAYAYDFIMQTSDGFGTVVGERGVMLSGGQRQRIAIARALLANAPVLILDEATSALDNESERYIHQSLEQLMHNRTTLVIAHRLSTIENADLIVVMDKGRIVEQGTHKDLLAMDGYYARLHSSGFEE